MTCALGYTKRCEPPVSNWLMLSDCQRCIVEQLVGFDTVLCFFIPRLYHELKVSLLKLDEKLGFFHIGENCEKFFIVRYFMRL